MERFDIVTTRELVDLIAQKNQGTQDFHLVNTLDELIYRNQTIPGSVSIPWSRSKELVPVRLGTNYDKLIITYCMGYR